MPDDRRNRVPGGTYFLTLNLLDRDSRLLTDHIDALRIAVRNIRTRAPFHIDARAILPEHMPLLLSLLDRGLSGPLVPRPLGPATLPPCYFMSDGRRSFSSDFAAPFS